VTAGLVTGTALGGQPTTGIPAAEAAACPTPAKSVLTATPATRARTVALTFDDGPTAHTPAVLAALRRHGVRGTFFVIGKHVNSQTAYGRQAVADGHVIGNHSWSHPTPSKGGAFNRLSASTQAAEMDQTTAAIRSKLGVTPCFFRAPGGATSATTVSLARKRGMTVANWTYDSLDWRSPQRADRAFQSAIYTRSASTRSRHPIVLMHDGGTTQYRGNTAAALDRVIPFYLKNGYTFTDPAGRVLPRFPKSVTAKPSTTAAPAGRALTISGGTAAIPKGAAVRLQRRSGTTWTTVASATVSAKNSYQVKTTVPRGKTTFRVWVAGKASATFTVTGQ
jgi:peptidoglycan/xylan/chitin deacetylase (PgdA/CDA1 family)